MLKRIVLSSSLIVSLNSYAGGVDKVVYGDDNRMDIFEANNQLHKKLATGTAAMIPNKLLEEKGNIVSVTGSTLEADGICSDARFAKQQTSAMCSGFLVGSDLLLTAGHCIETMSDCENNSWVFDYSNNTAERANFEISKNDIYKCSKIVARSLDNRTSNDFALIQLDRQSDRTPLTYRKQGKVGDNARLVVIGHPSGLPTKISDDANVRENKNKYYFQSNLDTFGGNSGSAVFDTATGMVEGILVRGERDYVLDSVSNCYRPKICKMDECRGEDVTRITNIKEL
ncbi:MAG: serine protease [Bacteriovorax sp.]|jgi:V8-like Glu-specific endopeptidase